MQVQSFEYVQNTFKLPQQVQSFGYVQGTFGLPQQVRDSKQIPRMRRHEIHETLLKRPLISMVVTAAPSFWFKLIACFSRWVIVRSVLAGRAFNFSKIGSTMVCQREN